jgi:hypothetical protein
MVPKSGFHSMIERPLPESRVMPPSTTVPKIIAAQASNQIPTAWSRGSVVARRIGEAEEVASIMIGRSRL